MNALKTLKQNITAKSAEIYAAREAYFIAKALEDTIKAQSEEIQRKILSDGDYLVCDELWNLENHRGLTERKITEPRNTYLMDEDIFINDFLEKCYAEYLKAGIADSRGKEYIPEADAHDARREAERILLQLALDILPDIPEKNALRQATKHWKYRAEMLDLILKLDI